jgi:anti-sigma regulatory factor (Ser/Thr protein kinase)
MSEPPSSLPASHRLDADPGMAIPVAANHTLLRLHLPAEQASLECLAEAVGELADTQDWPQEVRFHVDLVLEELAQNIVSYGYPDGRFGSMEVSLELADGGLLITVEDDGDPFDPFARVEPDLDAPLDEREIGGLGIHFTRTLMDECRYRRVDGRNRVQLRKSLTAASDA